MPRYIDEQEVFSQTDAGKDIFRYYFPEYDFGNRKAFVKVRSDEKTASALITYYNRQWRITDFGNQHEINSLNAIAFVMHKENLAYYEALLFIEQVIVRRSINGEGYVKPLWRPQYSFREMSPEDKKGAYSFVYKNKAEKSDLEALGPFVDQNILDKYNCKVVEYYEYCSFSKKLNKDVVHLFSSTPDYPIFVFDYGEFKKLYRPHDMEKKNRFSYVGEKPKDYIYGWRQLQGEESEFVDTETGEELPPNEKTKARIKDLFRCSGESDALNMASLGFHVYWLNSESAGFSDDRYRMIDDFCENHYQILDHDKTGMEMACKNALRHIDILSMTLPDWLTSKKDFRGNPCKDIKDFIAQYTDKLQAEYQVKVRKTKARKVKFWSRSEKGYEINMEYLFYFLKMNGFYSYRYSHIRNTDYCYVWIKGKVVDIIPPDQIKRVVKCFMKSWIKSKNLMDEISILNKLNTSGQITEANLETIEEISLNFINHNSDTEYLHFKNCSLKITKDEIKRVKHEELPNFILGDLPVKGKVISQLIDFSYTSNSDSCPIEVMMTEDYAALLEEQKIAKNEVEASVVNAKLNAFDDIDKYIVKLNDKSFIFTNFLQDIARIHWRKELEEGLELSADEKAQENLALANIMFAIGYLASQYKNQGKPWLVFLQDMKISGIGKSCGRSGKSLITKALTYVRNSFYIGGRELADQSKYQFIYDGFTEFHDIIEVDDFDEHANFSFFYTQITGNRTVNCKNTSPFVLEYRDSGKMIISSNFELPNTDNSTLARLLNVGVSDYYHEKTKYDDYKENRSPLTKFGRQLYLDFTPDEWNMFYYFVAYCIQLQMRFDKINPPMDNLEKRQYRKEMSSGLGRGENFMYWANDYFRLWDGVNQAPEYSIYGALDDTVVYLDTLFLRSEALNHFIDTSGIPDSKRRNFNAQNFKDKLDAWCKYNDYELNPVDQCSDKKNRRIIKKYNNKTTEFFFIRTKPLSDTEITAANVATEEPSPESPPQAYEQTRIDYEAEPF